MRRATAAFLGLSLIVVVAAPAAAQDENEAAEHHRKQGIKRLKSRDYGGAIASFNQAILLEPNHASTYYMRGQAKHFSKKLKAAIADYGKAIYYLPGFHQAYHNRGICYATLHQYKKALHDLEEAIRLRPKYARAFYTKASILGNMGEDEEAIADLTEAIRLVPGFHQAFFSRATANFRLGRFKKAKLDLAQALKLNPRIAKYHMVLGDTLQRLDQLKAAIAAYDASLKVKDGKTADGKTLRAQKLNNFLQARSISARGRARWLSGDKAGGLKDITTAADLTPEFAYTPLWVFALGGTAKRLNRLNATKDWIWNVVRLYRGRLSSEGLLSLARKGKTKQQIKEQLCEAYCYLALLAERRGEPAEAEKLYRQSVATKVLRFTEYHWARTRLVQMKKQGD